MSLPDFVPQKLTYRPDEVAALLNCCTRTVRRMMQCGEFGELVYVGTRARITFDGLVEYYSASSDDESPPEPIQKSLF
jgi:excisionase family DNA binding protein